jgi:hypothetical protein
VSVGVQCGVRRRRVFTATPLVREVLAYQ